jgi:DNA polymerase I-like protein with 3'-5' exonuclease and polymerase domains
MLSDIIVLDAETTVDRKEDGVIDNSAKNPKNKLVALGWWTEEYGYEHSVFHHLEKETPDSRSLLDSRLAAKKILVCHNAKFDTLQLLERGFKLPETIYCTMIGEYLFARGQMNISKSLKETAVRRRVTLKKSDLVDAEFKAGKGFEEIELAKVLEYLEADVLSCRDIYVEQQRDLETQYNKGLKPEFDLSMDMLQFLVEIERNGIKIDMPTLLEVERDYVAEKTEIQSRLKELVEQVMGDTPINLQSGADLSTVIYSRSVIDREVHRNVWNIGVNSQGKPLPAPRMNDRKFVDSVRATTRKVYKTVAHTCKVCNGKGVIQKYKKNGDPYKNISKCTMCDGLGAIYVPQSELAGLRLAPLSPRDASINGFKTDKITLNKLTSRANELNKPIAVEFITKIIRLHAINTYLDSFVVGIKRWTRETGLIHSEFNQTTTRTGRLSSTRPNYQNQPKGNKFPVRKAVVSRFENGSIVEFDYSGLEFRVAGILSGDKQIEEDIANGKDIHKQTASIVLQKPALEVTKDERSRYKYATFAPLYGGMLTTEPPHVQKYVKEFFNVYKGLAEWHIKLKEGVVSNGLVTTPSGRQFYFPNVKKFRNGRVSQSTQIVNFPCQSFATATIVPLSCVRALKKFKELDLKSKLILTVHDSIVVDCHPSEIDQVKKALVWSMRDITPEIKKRFDYDISIPLDVEMSVGKNWMEISEVPLD